MRVNLDDFNSIPEEPRKDGIVLQRADTVEPEDVEWLENYPNMIAYGLMTALVGMPGTNKTTFACRVAAQVTREGHSVMFVSAEDSPSTLRGRLTAAVSKLDKVMFGSVRKNGYDGGLILLPEDVQNLEEIIQREGIKLLIIDPVQAHFGAAIDSNRDQSVRSALAPLASVGINHHCAILLLLHLNKGMSRDPFTRAGGSIGIPAISRVCLLMGNHPDRDPSENLRVVVGFKNNLGPNAQAQTYALRLAHAEGFHEPQITLEWMEESRMQAYRLLGSGGE